MIHTRHISVVGLGYVGLPVAAVVAVSHREYRTLTADDLLARCLRPAVVIDVKGAYDRKALAAAGLRHWRL